MTSNLGKKPLTDITVPLEKDFFSKLATKASSSAIHKFERRVNGRGVVRAAKGCTLFI